MKKAEKATELNQKSPVALAEEKIVASWREKNIFQKSLDKPAPEGDYVFYDGPPFATGLPHYGHILVSAIKDTVPRYWTMRGKRVERRWGWDCHGLPIENIVEKELGVSGKKEIEALGVEKFNEHARSKVLEYVSYWKEVIDRMGRWVDFDGSYKTMDNTFIESVWWATKELWDKGRIYEGTKVLPYCPRCETPISSSEIAMDHSYKDITDISVYVKLELEDENAAGDVAAPKTFLVVWTTTPWTLPGNTAAAVNADIDYVKVKQGDAFYIVAKEKTSVFKEAFEIVEEFKGSALVGKTYRPIFNFFAPDTDAGKKILNRENGWKVYAAPYVTTEAGTGIVHLAPGYGEEDMALALEHKIPFVLHVGPDGKFTKELATPLEDGEHTVLAGLSAKPKPTKEEPALHQSSDILIIKHLAHTGALFAKEKIVHSYPHCFRCDTPVYYFALRAWFIKIQDAKKDMLAHNEHINWIPAHLKHGRFGKGIETAPDWNISRNRYWASPLPFWTCETCGETEAIGSLAELKARTKANNTYFVMRHGEAEHNTTDTISSSPDDKNPLTKKGREQVEETLKNLGNIDLIVSSDLMRTRQTSEIIAAKLGLSAEAVVYDERLRELKVGIFNGKKWSDYHNYFPTRESRFSSTPEGGETLIDLQNRVMATLFDYEKKYAGKNILFVTHGDSAFFLSTVSQGKSQEDIVRNFVEGRGFLGLGELKALDFSPYPHNKNCALDFHRPYIDEITFACATCAAAGKNAVMHRIPEVIDGWFESGSMPYAPHHYPFENKEKFERTFPAQFIVEYIAQTRTWFYYTHTLAVLLFGKNAFENVVATGTVLAEDGQKMSKSKGNFPDPKLIFDKYGVDALRFYMLSSPLMKSEDLNFSEKGVDEAYKKIILRLKNVVSFFETYKAESVAAKPDSAHVLDRWIVARLDELIVKVTQAMDDYEIDKAFAPIDAFLEDLSVWYLRRSRERLKNDVAARDTFAFVLLEFSKVIAPFVPFVAEENYGKLGGALESVHLENWPKARVVDEGVVSDMAETRRLASLALEARARAGIKVRQPLGRMVLKEKALEGKQDFIEILLDEVNIKTIEFDSSIDAEVMIDTTITPELRDEGMVRDLVRAMQDWRKGAGLKAGEAAGLVVSTSAVGREFVEKNMAALLKAATLSEISFGDMSANEGEVDGEAASEPVEVGGEKFVFSLRR